MAEYIVTVKEDVDWQEVHNELVARGKKVVKLRPNNPRNTHYDLTTIEANDLRNDARILSVQENNFKARAKGFQEHSDWRNTDGSTPWGLVRHTSATNLYGTSSTLSNNETYDYVLDGTGVDIVVCDTGINPDHDEFKDASGNSRVKQIDWYSEAGLSGPTTNNSGFYSDQNGHGTNIAGVIAGLTTGWAKNANIYSIKLDWADSSNGISVADAMDCILGWHNAKAGSRPTIVNHSWGYYSVFWSALPIGYVMRYDTLAYDSNRPTTGGVYRGTAHNDVNPIKWRENYGWQGWENGAKLNSLHYGHAQVTSVDVDVKALADAGIMTCIASGNDNNVGVRPGTEDYDNHFTFTGTGDGDSNAQDYIFDSGKYYYMRPGSPNFFGGNNTDTTAGLMVGAMDSTSKSVTLNQRTNWSNNGSYVDIYAVGINRKAPHSTSNSSYRSFGGTSNASPEVAGMCALLLQAHPDWTPKQVSSWMKNNATDKIYTGGTTDWTDAYSLWGSEQRVAYFPLNGQNVFSVSGS